MSCKENISSLGLVRTKFTRYSATFCSDEFINISSDDYLEESSTSVSTITIEDDQVSILL